MFILPALFVFLNDGTLANEKTEQSLELFKKFFMVGNGEKSRVAKWDSDSPLKVMIFGEDKKVTHLKEMLNYVADVSDLEVEYVKKNPQLIMVLSPFIYKNVFEIGEDTLVPVFFPSTKELFETVKKMAKNKDKNLFFRGHSKGYKTEMVVSLLQVDKGNEVSERDDFYITMMLYRTLFTKLVDKDPREQLKLFQNHTNKELQYLLKVFFDPELKAGASVKDVKMLMLKKPLE